MAYKRADFKLDETNDIDKRKHLSVSFLIFTA